MCHVAFEHSKTKKCLRMRDPPKAKEPHTLMLSLSLSRPLAPLSLSGPSLAGMLLSFFFRCPTRRACFGVTPSVPQVSGNIHRLPKRPSELDLGPSSSPNPRPFQSEVPESVPLSREVHWPKSFERIGLCFLYFTRFKPSS